MDVRGVFLSRLSFPKSFATAIFIAAAFVCGLLVLFASNARADKPDIAVTARNYGLLPAVQMAVISPGGDMLAFRRVDDQMDVVVVQSLEDGEIIRVADVSEVRPETIYFIDDEHLILQVSHNTRFRGFRGRHDVSAAYSYNIKTADLHQLLIPGHRIYTGQTDVGRIVGVSPDGTYVYMPAYAGRGDHDINPRYSLMRVEINRPRVLRAHARGHRHSFDFLVSPEGDPVADLRYNNDRGVFSILVPDGRSWREIFEMEAPILPDAVQGIMPDGKHLVYLTEEIDSGRFGYAQMSLEDGSRARMPIERDEADIDYIITDINRVAHGVAYAGFTPEYQMFDKALDRRIKQVQGQFAEHSVQLVDWSRDWEHILFYVEGPTTSGQYYLASREKPLQYVAAARPHIPVDKVHLVADFSYPARDELVIPALITVPLSKVDAPANLPLVVLAHGGPHAHDKKTFDWQAQALAEHGYLVVQPQFRGSTGFGVALYRAGFGEWGGKMQDDLTDAVQALVESGLADPQRVCIMGGSYGGYAALAGVAFTPKLYRCAISINGVSDINRMMRDDRRKYGRRHWLLHYFERSIANNQYSRDRINSISPVNFAEQIEAPVLLIHGEDDDVVPEQQSIIMYRALNRADKPVTYIKLADENHHLMQSESRIEVLTQVLHFLDEHLAPLEEDQ